MNELKRFDALHQKNPESGCWLWVGAVSDTGYAYFKIHTQDGKRKQVYAHIWSYETFVGATNGLFVLHRCDVRNCCNPNHLFLGTHQDNMADRNEKGRQAKGESHGMFNNGHKITEAVAASIREATGSHASIAADFSVSRQLVGHIKLGKRWVRQ